jgi:hypothetical protein
VVLDAEPIASSRRGSIAAAPAACRPILRRQAPAVPLPELDMGEFWR